jgi:hypothetical protein
MSGELVTAVLSEAKHRFGTITPANQHEVAQWVKQRVEAIKSGHAPPVTVAHPTLPRTFERSWYEPSEPGSDDE